MRKQVSNSTVAPSLDFASLSSLYRTGELLPTDVISHVFDRIAERGNDGVWINVASRTDALSRAVELERDRDWIQTLPLYGLPFSVKDCIDVAGIPTTSACPASAYTPTETNPAILRLIAAGAIFVGKTNLDQWATGLVGVRSPYGVSRNPFDARYIPGGSSSGAAVSVSAGLVSFGIGTDTGGSGRVPAGCNNVVGLKPTRGLMSTSKMVWANRSIDCLSVFALTCPDASKVLDVAQAYDPENPYSRQPVATPNSRDSYSGAKFTFGVPAAKFLEFFGNDDARKLFDSAIQTLNDMGGTCHEIDFTPMLEANRLLFFSSWVAERMVSVKKVMGGNANVLDDLLPITKKIIGAASTFSAVDAYETIHQLQALRHQSEPMWNEIDILVMPTTGTIYQIAEIESDPIKKNADMGYYTYFVNMFDLATIAVPNGFQRNGLPTGITLNAPAFSDRYLASIGAAFHKRRGLKLGATSIDVPS